MTDAVTLHVPRQIRGNGVEPSGKLAGRPKPGPVLINADESFLGGIRGFGFILQQAKQIMVEPFGVTANARSGVGEAAMNRWTEIVLIAAVLSSLPEITAALLL